MRYSRSVTQHPKQPFQDQLKPAIIQQIFIRFAGGKGAQFFAGSTRILNELF